MALPLIPIAIGAGIASLLGYSIFERSKAMKLASSGTTAQQAQGRVSLVKGSTYQVDFFTPANQAVMLGPTGWQPIPGKEPSKVSAGVKLPDGRGPYDGYTMMAQWTGPTSDSYYMVNPIVAGKSGNVMAAIRTAAGA